VRVVQYNGHKNSSGGSSGGGRSSSSTCTELLWLIVNVTHSDMAELSWYHLYVLSIDQSIDPSIHPLIHQSINQSIKSINQSINQSHTHIKPFNGLWSGTTQVGRYQKKHPPTHTHPDHRTSFINQSINQSLVTAGEEIEHNAKWHWHTKAV